MDFPEASDLQLSMPDEKRQISVITELTDDFECVNYVIAKKNRFDDIAILYRTSGRFASIIPGWMDENRFHNRLELIEEYIVCDEDKAEFHRNTRRNVIEERLRHDAACFVNFRAKIDSEICYYQLKFAADKNESGEIAGFAFGIHNIDDETKHTIEIKEKLERNLEIINVLASEYSSLYYIDMATGRITPYVMNEKTQSELGQIFRKDISYSEALKFYVSRMVFESDKEKVLRTGSLSNIRQQLAKQKSFSATYRNNESLPHYCEIRFIKVDDDDGEPTAVALAFADKDDEIVGRYIEENLGAEYLGIFLVDIENDTFRVYKYSDNADIANFEKGASWSHTLRLLADKCSEDSKEEIRKMSDPLTVREFLRDENRREFLYRLDRDESIWRRCVMQVIERCEGNPVTVLVCIATLDSITTEKEELNRRVAAQNRQLIEQQEALEQAIGMAQAANRAKTLFLNNISHDIRTPMNAIIGFSVLANSRIDNKDIVKDYLRKISQASEHLLLLINEVLDMSRIESGKMNLDEQEESILDIMQILRDMLENDARDKNIHFRVYASDMMDEHIICDKTRLNQILLNVVSNAVKYTPEGGNVTVVFNEKGISEYGYATYEILVTDTGIGMSEEFLNNIFEPFTRANNTVISGIHGTGLGMAITKSLIDMMGGNIEIKSRENEGTEVLMRFDFKLVNSPQNKSKPKPVMQYKADITDFDGMKVLLVEDVELNLELAQQMLEDCGMKVETAFNGEEAVREIENSAPGDFDLVLMDIQMPVMDGYEATRRIRALADPELAGVPIIAMTANAFAEDRQMALDAGMNAHIAKPIKMDRIVEVLMDVLKK